MNYKFKPIPGFPYEQYPWKYHLGQIQQPAPHNFSRLLLNDPVRSGTMETMETMESNQRYLQASTDNRRSIKLFYQERLMMLIKQYQKIKHYKLRIQKLQRDINYQQNCYLAALSIQQNRQIRDYYYRKGCYPNGYQGYEFDYRRPNNIQPYYHQHTHIEHNHLDYEFQKLQNWQEFQENKQPQAQQLRRANMEEQDNSYSVAPELEGALVSKASSLTLSISNFTYELGKEYFLRKQMQEKLRRFYPARKTKLQPWEEMYLAIFIHENKQAFSKGPNNKQRVQASHKFESITGRKWSYMNKVYIPNFRGRTQEDWNALFRKTIEESK